MSPSVSAHRQKVGKHLPLLDEEIIFLQGDRQTHTHTHTHSLRCDLYNISFQLIDIFGCCHRVLTPVHIYIFCPYFFLHFSLVLYSKWHSGRMIEGDLPGSCDIVYFRLNQIKIASFSIWNLPVLKGVSQTICSNLFLLFYFKTVYINEITSGV